MSEMKMRFCSATVNQGETMEQWVKRVGGQSGVTEEPYIPRTLMDVINEQNNQPKEQKTNTQESQGETPYIAPTLLGLYQDQKRR